ncbi:uncharacterized protein LOC143032326 isoform X2 [Oratosquilla oratoria]|uniref:uncharacterized protein LOC143032326 isoform X2 n=1 Tax=Oratosquilla oratoria TaxID=337810 RepID=UPI003F76219B
MKMMLARGGAGGDHWRAPSSPSIPCSPCIQHYPNYWIIGRVKFGVPLEQVCKNDIPGPLLVLILKLNKEGPTKKDVFRAPGHQGSMKKLIHFLQNGRLVNIDNFSVYTIASVLKKFLRKLPEGIFGKEGEHQLFNIIQLSDTEQQRDEIHRLITSMPVVTQHLLVLLFGTFRVIAMNSTRAQTGMTSEALGVSVAPSFFQSCVADGKTARMEDVMRFKVSVTACLRCAWLELLRNQDLVTGREEELPISFVCPCFCHRITVPLFSGFSLYLGMMATQVATQIMKFLIDNFGVSNLFGRANYEYYARITGRILKVEEDWIFAFRYPPDSLVAPMANQEESQSTPALIHIPESASSDVGGLGVGGMGMGGMGGGTCGEVVGMGAVGGGGGGGASVVPENNLRESCTRLSISLEENGLYKGGGRDSSSGSSHSALRMTLDELRQVNRYAESTKSLSYLPQVHERQTERMRTRSEWFLAHSPQPSPLTPLEVECQPHAVNILRSESINRPPSGGGSSESIGRVVRRSSSKDKERRLVRRSSSKKDKENGQKGVVASRGRSSSTEVKTPTTHYAGDHLGSPPRRVLATSLGPVGLGAPPAGADPVGIVGALTDHDCTETDVQRVHVSITYKPRI